MGNVGVDAGLQGGRGGESEGVVSEVTWKKMLAKPLNY